MYNCGEVGDSLNVGGTNESDGLISINNATKDELISLPGVGPATADKIIAARPYKTIEELLNVSGIGEKTLDQIRDLIKL